jgi:hypothetical protein
MILSCILVARRAFLLAAIRASVFFMWHLCYGPVDVHHQHRQEADAFHSVSFHLVFFDFRDGVF